MTGMVKTHTANAEPTAAIVIPKTKRVVSKAFDGTAAINALLMRKMGGGDFSRIFSVAEGLLGHGICRSDVQRVCGIPQKMVALAARQSFGNTRLGRRPVELGILFDTPLSHLRVSIFLSVIARLEPDLPSGKAAITGDVLLAALDHAEMVCGALTDRQTISRYYLTAVHKLSTGEIYLRTCGTCSTRYVRTRREVTVRGTNGVMIGGECPYCRYLNWLKKGPKRRKVAEGQGEARNEIHSAVGKVAAQPIDTQDAMPDFSDDSGARDIGTASFAAIMG